MAAELVMSVMLLVSVSAAVGAASPLDEFDLERAINARDAFEILELDRKLQSIAAVNKAYRHQSLRVHPDKWCRQARAICSKAHSAFVRVADARDALLDTEEQLRLLTDVSVHVGIQTVFEVALFCAMLAAIAVAVAGAVRSLARRQQRGIRRAKRRTSHIKVKLLNGSLLLMPCEPGGSAVPHSMRAEYEHMRRLLLWPVIAAARAADRAANHAAFVAATARGWARGLTEYCRREFRRHWRTLTISTRLFFICVGLLSAARSATPSPESVVTFTSALTASQASISPFMTSLSHAAHLLAHHEEELLTTKANLIRLGPGGFETALERAASPRLASIFSEANECSQGAVHSTQSPYITNRLSLKCVRACVLQIGQSFGAKRSQTQTGR